MLDTACYRVLMGKHRKQSRLQKNAAIAVPVVAAGAFLLAASTHPSKTVNTANVMQRTVVPVVSQTVVHPDTWYLAKARSEQHAPPHIVRHRHHSMSFNQKVVRAAESQLGVPYVWGGETPYAAFDCSGLVQYAYGVAGHWVPRVANDQFNFFRMIPKSWARPGDLVFFHDDSDPSSYVYHVGIFLGGNDMMVVAPDAGSNVQIQNFDWGGDTVTFGTLDIH